MNRIKEELLKNATFMFSEGSAARATIFFSKNFSAFSGHFPDNPIVPGVCLTQAVCVLLEKFYKKPIGIKEIISAKFFAPVTAEETITIACDIKNISAQEAVATAKISNIDKKVSQLELKVEIKEHHVIPAEKKLF